MLCGVNCKQSLGEREKRADRVKTTKEQREKKMPERQERANLLGEIY